MNRFRIELAHRGRLENMTPEQLDRTALDLLDNVKANAKLLAEATGRTDTDAIAAELITESSVRRVTDIHWLRHVIPAHAPELMPLLAPGFPQEQWLHDGRAPTPRSDADYLDESLFWTDLAREQLHACEKAANKPGATYSDRLNELVAHAEYRAGDWVAWEGAAAHRREELINALAAMLTSLCSPDSASGEAYSDVGGVWRDRTNGTSWPCGFDGYKRQTGGGVCSRFELAPADDVNWVH